MFNIRYVNGVYEVYELVNGETIPMLTCVDNAVAGELQAALAIQFPNGVTGPALQKFERQRKAQQKRFVEHPESHGMRGRTHTTAVRDKLSKLRKENPTFGAMSDEAKQKAAKNASERMTTNNPSAKRVYCIFDVIVLEFDSVAAFSRFTGMSSDTICYALKPVEEGVIVIKNGFRFFK